jgi:tetratricopeptide (TPR) repeat protein
MYYRKKTTYSGRWLVKMLEAALIFGIIFYTVDALQGVFQPQVVEEPVVIVTNTVQPVEVVRVEPQRVEPETAPVYSDYDYFVMGYYHQVAEEYYEAISDYTRALELNPDLSSAWLNRGVAYEQLNNDYRAMQDFNRFLSRDGLTVVRHRGVITGARLNVEMVEDRVYEFNIYVRAGETVDFSAVGHGGDVVDPLIMVLDGDGNPVAASDDMLRQDGSLISMNSSIRGFEILQTGVYTLRVSHAGGGESNSIEGTLQVNLEVHR